METVADFTPKLLDRDSGEHHFIALFSEICLPGTSYQYRYAIQFCTVCGLVQRGPWFEQSSGPAENYAFYVPGKSPMDQGHGLDKQPECIPHCYKCLKRWGIDEGVSLVNDGDDSMGPAVCCDCYESGVEPESPV